MSIQVEEIKWFKSLVVNDNANNGGRMSSLQLASAVAGNIFPNVSEADRIAGIPEQFRKVFIKVDSPEDLTLLSGTIYQHNMSPGDDRLVMFAGTMTDTQTDLTGTERLYGSGVLDVTALTGVSELSVLVEDATYDTFQNGDTILISNKETPDGAGDQELLTIDSVPTVDGNVITFTVSTPVSYDFLMNVTHVSSVMSLGDVGTSTSGFTVTSAGDGDYDNTTYEVTLNNSGAVYQNWTLTFTSATAYDIEGDTLGAVGSGNVSGGASPLNTNTATPYFELAAAGFSGTFQAGDTITFTTVPAAAPVWFRRTVPAASSPISSNVSYFVVGGESV